MSVRLEIREVLQLSRRWPPPGMSMCPETLVWKSWQMRRNMNGVI